MFSGKGYVRKGYLYVRKGNPWALWTHLRPASATRCHPVAARLEDCMGNYNARRPQEQVLKPVLEAGLRCSKCLLGLYPPKAHQGVGGGWEPPWIHPQDKMY